MKEDFYEDKASEAHQLTQKMFGMLLEANPDPRVALTAFMVMSAQLAAGMDLTKMQALDGFNETWNLVINRDRGTMQ